MDHDTSSYSIASFPGPAQLSVACSMKKRDFSFAYGERLQQQIIYMYIVIIPTEYCAYMYRIELNFRGSKFSRIVIFEDFVEIILQTRCTRILHATCQKFSLKYFREQLKICEIREIKDP